MSGEASVILLSGGLDSTTLLYYLRHRGDEIYPLAIRYGQRHSKEIEAAEEVARSLNLTLEVINIAGFAYLMSQSGSALVNPRVEVPLGHYESETMKSTIVPNRNMIFASLAAAYAVAVGAQSIALAVHQGDHAIYPDCRWEFIESLQSTIQIGLEGYTSPILVEAPFVDIPKSSIVRMGAAFGVPYELTWSCYKGGSVHCGQCGTCVERKEAFSLAGIHDPTEYEV